MAYKVERSKPIVSSTTIGDTSRTHQEDVDAIEVIGSSSRAGGLSPLRKVPGGFPHSPVRDGRDRGDSPSLPLPVTASRNRPARPARPDELRARSTTPDIPGRYRSDSADSIGRVRLDAADRAERGQSEALGIPSEEIRKLEEAMRDWRDVPANMDLEGLARTINKVVDGGSVQEVPKDLVREALGHILAGMPKVARDRLIDSWERAIVQGGREATIPSQAIQLLTYGVPLALIPISDERDAAIATLTFRAIWLALSPAILSVARPRFTVGQEVERMRSGLDIKVSTADVPDEPKRSAVTKETKALLAQVSEAVKGFDASLRSTGIDMEGFASADPEDAKEMIRSLSPQDVFALEDSMGRLAGFAAHDGDRSLPTQIAAFRNVQDRDARHSARENPTILQAARILKPAVTQIAGLLLKQVPGMPWPIEHGLPGWAAATLTAGAYVPIALASYRGGGQGELDKRASMFFENLRNADSILTPEGVKLRNERAAGISEEPIQAKHLDADGLMAMLHVPVLKMQAKMMAAIVALAQDLQAELDVVEGQNSPGSRLEAERLQLQIDLCEARLMRVRNGVLRSTPEEDHALEQLSAAQDDAVEAMRKLQQVSIKSQAFLGRDGAYKDMMASKKGDFAPQIAQNTAASGFMVGGGQAAQGLVGPIQNMIAGGGAHADRRVKLGLWGFVETATIVSALFFQPAAAVYKEEARGRAKQRKADAAAAGRDPNKERLWDLYVAQGIKTAFSAFTEIPQFFKDRGVSDRAMKAGAAFGARLAAARQLGPAVDAVARELRARGLEGAVGRGAPATVPDARAPATVDDLLGDIAGEVEDVASGSRRPRGQDIPMTDLRTADVST